MLAVVALLASTGVALASDASYDQKELRTASSAPAPKDTAAKTIAAPVATCGCPHGRS
jgi:hypothetical protein